ncbi:chemoreceptor glutamine deamidase CheD [Marinomonas mediterranea]|jgi:Chemotaxis protein; stimulates methylation of MCP proteins|uniref:Probable chemoreceptor glutamine deamidase CheD n=1 Tax=Marinomonas mediterranea (strain ATCC 700492 / JCM 21426 / NBRC 103028 / MMB-1) TaxID=717774 RepID=F2JTV8_MARM1|nr:chemoreceptor glutamine deamidase CheD [Marinomonas mediterranea]ADZ90379.1 CheD [Marinomonas mediterranea MMB-1]WCN08435.1 chemoreceptor glutamine deamidase CheD [Marinomonas mediterranea]WCN12489.1 chemoreceptor glutamine deamidase CheD [Marinomonas mediterranea]WCN16561.1 chemoreceptor glutamine deamidase CheD [Marinomonas mediterranea MMB-1]
MQSGSEVDHFATHRFFDSRFNMETVKVLPGEFYASGNDEMVTTLLGSCVAVCLYDEEAHVGGMNHFLLPEQEQTSEFLLSTSARYGVHSMELLINHLIKIGGRRNHLSAKVFGGASVLSSNISNVGENNVRFTKCYLNNEGIPVTGLDVYEDCPRRVNFFPATGRVLMKRLKPRKDNKLVEQELGYKRSISSDSGFSGDVDLF